MKHRYLIYHIIAIPFLICIIHTSAFSIAIIPFIDWGIFSPKTLLAPAGIEAEVKCPESCCDDKKEAIEILERRISNLENRIAKLEEKITELKLELEWEKERLNSKIDIIVQLAEIEIDRLGGRIDRKQKEFDKAKRKFDEEKLLRNVVQDAYDNCILQLVCINTDPCVTLECLDCKCKETTLCTETETTTIVSNCPPRLETFEKSYEVDCSSPVPDPTTDAKFCWDSQFTGTETISKTYSRGPCSRAQ